MISYLANPQRFLRVSKWARPLAGAIAIVGMVIGVIGGLFIAPQDALQGDLVRIMYVHLPSASLSLMLYTAIAVFSLIGFVWRHPMADLVAKELAVPGLAFTALCLITGSLWGRPAWGTYWQWDGRMTSVLVLLLIYLGYLGVWATVEDRTRAARIAGILAMVGVINIPIIKFSVEWWNTLHQPASISTPGAPGMPFEILWPNIAMFFGFAGLSAWVVLRRVEAEIARLGRRRRNTPVATATLETIQ